MGKKIKKKKKKKKKKKQKKKKKKKKHFVFWQTRIRKIFCYRGASAQFFFALGKFLQTKDFNEKKSKICIFELKFFPVCAILKFFKNHYMRKLIFNSIFCFFSRALLGQIIFASPSF